MKLLHKLTPAEAQLILKSSDATLKELVKYTSMDLLLKNVLRVEKSFHQPHPKDPPQEYTYVTHGESFARYKPLPHEALILSPFLRNPTFYILFKTFVKLAFENSKGVWNFQYSIKKSPKIADYFKQGFLNNLFKAIHLNKLGSRLRADIKKEIEHLNQLIPHLVKNEKDEVYKIIDSIKGNVFLLNNFDLNLIKEYNESLFDEMEKDKGSDGSGCGGCFSSYSDSFDSSCSGESGCGGDSGCGGSGCSGCGGCGGD